MSKSGWGYYLFLRAGQGRRPTSYEGKYGFLFESTRGYFAELYAYCWMETRKRFLISIAAPEKNLSLHVRKLAEGNLSKNGASCTTPHPSKASFHALGEGGIQCVAIVF